MEVPPPSSSNAARAQDTYTAVPSGHHGGSGGGSASNTLRPPPSPAQDDSRMLLGVPRQSSPERIVEQQLRQQQLGDVQRGVGVVAGMDQDQRVDARDATVAAPTAAYGTMDSGTQGTQGGAIRFHVPQRGMTPPFSSTSSSAPATTTMQDTPTPSCACDCHDPTGHHVHSSASGSTSHSLSPPPLTRPPLPSPPPTRDTVPFAVGVSARDRDGERAASREMLAEDQTPRPAMRSALPEQEQDGSQWREREREVKVQRTQSILLRDKDKESTSSSQEPLLPRDPRDPRHSLSPKDHTHSTGSSSRVSSHGHGGVHTKILLDAPLPNLPRDDSFRGDVSVQGLRRARTRDSVHVSPEYYTNGGGSGNGSGGSTRPLPPSRGPSGIDWIVPLEEDEKTTYSRSSRPNGKRLTVAERLQPTLDLARETRGKLAKSARMTKYLQNGAIGAQVLLGSLTTGLSAVATTGRQMAVQTTILGGLTTIVASYLAKTRNSDEAESARERVSALDGFIRTCTSFLLDWGWSDDPVWDERVRELRREFDVLLDPTSGNGKNSGGAGGSVNKGMSGGEREKNLKADSKV